MVGVVPYPLRVLLDVLAGDVPDSELMKALQRGEVLLCDCSGVGPIKEHGLDDHKVELRHDTRVGSVAFQKPSHILPTLLRLHQLLPDAQQIVILLQENSS